MTGRLFFPLIIFISTLGVECSQNDIKIITFSEDIDSKFKNIGAKLSSGEPKPKINPLVFVEDGSGSACFTSDYDVIIKFKVDLGKDWTVNLNTAMNSYNFKSREDKTTLEGEAKEKNCFLFGSWRHKNSETIQLYLNFLPHSLSNQDKLVYFKSVIEDKNQISRLMISDNYNLEEDQQEMFQKLIPEKYKKKQERGLLGKAFGYCYSDSKEDKVIFAKFEETETLIKECQTDQKICIGNLRCRFSVNSGFSFKSSMITMQLKGSGEFNMVFVKEDASNMSAKKAATDFAKSGTTEAITTAFADVECSLNGFDFLLHRQKNLRLLTDSKVMI